MPLELGKRAPSSSQMEVELGRRAPRIGMEPPSPPSLLTVFLFSSFFDYFVLPACLPCLFLFGFCSLYFLSLFFLSCLPFPFSSSKCLFFFSFATMGPALRKVRIAFATQNTLRLRKKRQKRLTIKARQKARSEIPTHIFAAGQKGGAGVTRKNPTAKSRLEAKTGENVGITPRGRRVANTLYCVGFCGLIRKLRNGFLTV